VSAFHESRGSQDAHRSLRSTATGRQNSFSMAIPIFA
jgi:hypothetical protein